VAKKSQKVSGDLGPFQVREADSYPVTLSARTSGWTEAGKVYLEQADSFCACTRLIVDRLLREIPYSKPELRQRFELSSRLFNSAEVSAKGEFESVTATKLLALEQARKKYWTAIHHYAQGYLQGMEHGDELRLLARIGKWRRRMEKHEATLDRPTYFPGRQRLRASTSDEQSSLPEGLRSSSSQPYLLGGRMG
jgi:hypothetical protein